MAQKYMQTFSDRLRLARRDAQLTQKQLIAKMAELEQEEWRVQVGQTYISELEKPGSDRMPNGEALVEFGGGQLVDEVVRHCVLLLFRGNGNKTARSGLIGPLRVG